MILFESERLYFREWVPSDAAGLYELNRAPEVQRFTGDPPFQSIAEARQFILKYEHYTAHGFGRWAVVLKSDSQFIGWCGLKQHETYVDLGYRIVSKHWNQGYATEAARATISYAFEHLHMEKLVGRCMPDNKASIAVLIKAGMKFWKTGECEGMNGAHYFAIENPHP